MGTRLGRKEEKVIAVLIVAVLVLIVVLASWDEPPPRGIRPCSGVSTTPLREGRMKKGGVNRAPLTPPPPPPKGQAPYPMTGVIKAVPGEELLTQLAERAKSKTFVFVDLGSLSSRERRDVLKQWKKATEGGTDVRER